MDQLSPIGPESEEVRVTSTTNDACPYCGATDECERNGCHYSCSHCGATGGCGD